MTVLKDITIKNYRTFNTFEVPFAKHINLIVGSNNAGKSSLLEAIDLLTSDDPSISLIRMLNERGEYVNNSRDSTNARLYGSGYQINSIFYGRNMNIDDEIVISSKAGDIVRITLSTQDQNKRLVSGQYKLSISDYTNDNDAIDELPPDLENEVLWVYIEKMNPHQVPDVYRLRVENDLIVDRYPLRKRMPNTNKNTRYVTTDFVGYDDLALLWDNITLTPQEDKVVEALQVLEPTVERISFTSRQTSNSGILLRMKDAPNPISLGSMGDGMRRALAIAASLVSVENGTLLVDEIDTGLYYGVLKNIWSLIIETSIKRNVQVFATTHSWDCVRAFQAALMPYSEQNVGQLIRLDKLSNGRIKPTIYTAEELEIAIQQDIEVR